jgi:hypothetical protein
MKNIYFYVTAEEDVSGVNASSYDDSGTTQWQVGATAHTPPTVQNILVNDTSLELGHDLKITCDVTDPVDGDLISSVTAYIEHPDETVITGGTLTMYDDGPGGGHGDATGGDDEYTCIWDSSTESVGTNYYIDITAIDAWTSNNQRDVNNGATFNI